MQHWGRVRNLCNSLCLVTNAKYLLHLANHLGILSKSMGDFVPEGKDSFLFSARWQERAQSLIMSCQSQSGFCPSPH
eukprot:10287401-Heterocapsa_arctica.AAC.1